MLNLYNKNFRHLPPNVSIPLIKLLILTKIPSDQMIWSLKFKGSQVALVVKNLPANAGDIRDLGSIPGSERCPGGKNDNTLQCFCLENSMDRGAWRAAVPWAYKESDAHLGLNPQLFLTITSSSVHQNLNSCSSPQN